MVEMEKQNVATRIVTLQFPVIKVDNAYDIPSDEVMMETYVPGMYVFDDAVQYHLVVFDGRWKYCMALPRAQFDSQIVQKAVQNERDTLASAFEEHANGLNAVIIEMSELRHMFKTEFKELSETISKNIAGAVETLPRNSGVDILDVARSIAVIQRPELITELNKGNQ